MISHFLPCRHWYSNAFTLATLPICKRAAIQATVTSVSCRNRAAIFTFSRSPLARSPNVASVHRRRRNSSATTRSAFSTWLSCRSSP
jgi:hypothetical protein